MLGLELRDDDLDREPVRALFIEFGRGELAPVRVRLWRSVSVGDSGVSWESLSLDGLARLIRSSRLAMPVGAELSGSFEELPDLVCFPTERTAARGTPNQHSYRLRIVF